MTKSQAVQFFKRYPLLLLSLLAALQVAGVLLLVYRRQAPPPAISANPAVPMPTTSLPPTLASPSPSPSKPAKTATKTSAPPQPAAATASPQPPALTPEQQAVNQQYKESFVAAASMVDSLIEMRVAIAEGVPALSVGSAAEAMVMDQNRNPLLTLAASTSYSVQPNSSGLSVNGSQLPQIILIEPANGGLFTLGDRTYRGRLLLVNDGGKIWAVNLVNLRHYLHSVVASEVSPSWKPEALKAQAVAARSYALTYHIKPMSSLFDLGATEYYQVYSGIDREAPETNQAVDATAGQFVSYRGGVVESLYAASDDIVIEAFQGRGMSQLGALNLAEQGYTYGQILANYYPGTALGQIVQDYQ